MNPYLTINPLEKSVIEVTVYYACSSWHELIQFIGPILRENYKNGILDTYYVKFGLYRGDHVKLIFRSFENGNKIRKKIELLIEQFLLANPSETKVVEYPLHTFFMDYPNNSVGFNQTYESAADGLEIMRWQASLALLDALGSEKIDLACIYTFMGYMQIGILKAAYPDVNLARANATNLLCYLNNLNDAEKNVLDTEGMQHGSYFKQLFDDNQDVLAEIVKDVYENIETNPELKWIGEWEIACRKFLVGGNFTSSFILLSQLIYEQMGFMDYKNLFQFSSMLISAIELS